MGGPIRTESSDTMLKYEFESNICWERAAELYKIYVEKIKRTAPEFNVLQSHHTPISRTQKDNLYYVSFAR